MSRERPESVRLLSAGILLAGVVMMARVAGITVLLNAPLAGQIIVPIAVAGAVLGLSAFLLALGHRGPTGPLAATENPLAIGTALKLGAVVVAVMLAVGYLRSALGPAGVLLVAGVSGIFDADALTISMGRLGGNGLDIRTAAQAMMIGVAVNTCTKAIMAVSISGWRLGLMVSVASLAALTAGLAVASALS